MKIAVDVDDVLVPLAKTFYDYHNKNFGTDIDGDSLIHYRWDHHMNIPLSQSVKRVNDFYKTDLFKNMPIFENAKESLKQLSKDHELVIISSRFGVSKEFTKEWANKEFPDIFSDIIFSAEYHYEEEYKKSKNIKEKAFVCLDNNINLIIEDSLIHAIECAKNGIKVFLLDKPWNQGELPDNITRVKNWNEISQELNSLSTASK